MKKLLNLLPAISLAVAMLASHPALAAADAATVMGTINGGGTALMMSGPTAGGKSVSSFGFEATLYSDGTARGHFDCVDQMGDTMPGNVFGNITGWSRDASTQDIVLHVTDGKFLATPGGFVVSSGLHFTVTIQRFGGAGVGHWTLTNGLGKTICIELLISGQITASWN